MPYATTKDNVKLYYEEAGSGTPILFGHEFAGDHRNWEDQMRFFEATGGLARPFMRSPERGADTVVWAASSPELDGVTGGYFHDRRPKRPSKRSLDEATAKRLWQVSEELTGASW